MQAIKTLHHTHLNTIVSSPFLILETMCQIDRNLMEKWWIQILSLTPTLGKIIWKNVGSNKIHIGGERDFKIFHPGNVLGPAV